MDYLSQMNREQQLNNGLEFDKNENNDNNENNENAAATAEK